MTYDAIGEDPSAAGLLAELDRKSASRKLALPTNDLDVKRALRKAGEPICLFGEKREDRRERLRQIIFKQRTAAGLDGEMGSSDDDDDDSSEEEKEEEFYTEGTASLEQARRYIASYSLPRAKRRVERQRKEANLPLARIMDTRKAVFAELKVGKRESLSCPDSTLIIRLVLFRRHILHSDHNLPTTVQYARCGSLRILAC